MRDATEFLDELRAKQTDAEKREFIEDVQRDVLDEAARAADEDWAPRLARRLRWLKP